MSSTLRVTNVTDTTGGTSTNLMSGLAKAWSNLNGTGTIAERDSFNISGYVDNGTGNYTFTIANDMGDTNYGGHGNCDRIIDTTNATEGCQYANILAGSQDFICVSATPTADDQAMVLMSILGDLA